MGYFIKVNIGKHDIKTINLLQKQPFFVSKKFINFISDNKNIELGLDEASALKSIDLLCSKQEKIKIYFTWFVDFRLRKYTQGAEFSPTQSKAMRAVIAGSFRDMPEKLERMTISGDAQVLKSNTLFPLDKSCLKEKESTCLTGTNAVALAYYRTLWRKVINKNDTDQIIGTDLDKIKKQLQQKLSRDQSLEHSVYKYNIHSEKPYQKGLISLDHIASGFMILSLLFKDKDAALKMNLIDKNHVFDLYQEIADEIKKTITIKKKALALKYLPMLSYQHI